MSLVGLDRRRDLMASLRQRGGPLCSHCSQTYLHPLLPTHSARPFTHDSRMVRLDPSLLHRRRPCLYSCDRSSNFQRSCWNYSIAVRVMVYLRPGGLFLHLRHVLSWRRKGGFEEEVAQYYSVGADHRSRRFYLCRGDVRVSEGKYTRNEPVLSEC